MGGSSKRSRTGGKGIRLSNGFIMENECCLDKEGETDKHVIFTLSLLLVDSVTLIRYFLPHGASE